MATQKAVDKGTEEVGIPKGKHENYKGTITAVDAGSITLALKDGTGITVMLTGETRIKIPTNKEATFADLGTGMKVMVQAIGGQDDLSNCQVSGAYSRQTRQNSPGWDCHELPGGDVHHHPGEGWQLYTFLLTTETKILPAEGAGQLQVGVRVTIIAPRDVSSMDQTATGIVVHPATAEE